MIKYIKYTIIQPFLSVYDKYDIYILCSMCLSIFMIYTAFVKINDISILSIGYNMNEIGEIIVDNINKQNQVTEWKQIIFIDFFWKGISGTFNDLLSERSKTIEKMIISILFKESHSVLQSSLQVCTPFISTTIYDTVNNIISIYSSGIDHTNDCIKTQVGIQILYIQSKYNAIFNTYMNRMNITIHSSINIFRIGVTIGCSGIICFYYRKKEVKQKQLLNESTKNTMIYDIENKIHVSKKRKRK